ncbi:hypothetical protein [Methylobacterium sp. NEAU K]|uniref:hypothetical protein n=1 Tax=Methylobacterium sp. NEAU K TaxID=3064946 RepID=UPI00273478A2|nr:hypothetical protein [Methylobacterium sp. NEAU K]MDP4003279.1 hypothetical protein [Methylobacterium sp. NEAU K]
MARRDGPSVGLHTLGRLHPQMLVVPFPGHAERSLPDAWRKQHAGARTPEGLQRVRTVSLIRGRRSAAHVAMKWEIRANYFQLREMVKAANAEWREEQRPHRELLRRFGR